MFIRGSINSGGRCKTHRKMVAAVRISLLITIYVAPLEMHDCEMTTRRRCGNHERRGSFRYDTSRVLGNDIRAIIMIHVSPLEVLASLPPLIEFLLSSSRPSSSLASPRSVRPRGAWQRPSSNRVRRESDRRPCDEYFAGG